MTTTQTTAKINAMADRFMRIRKVQHTTRDGRKARNCQASLDQIVLDALAMGLIEEFHAAVENRK